MYIQFEVWIENQGFSEETKELFRESIKCYKVSAYRGAYLLSYVAFLSVVKERILKSEKPDFVGQEEWADIQKKLIDDNEWEVHINKIFDKTDKKNNGRSRYFLINSHLLEDIKYFKRRRNDCAHAKETKIDYSHVDVLWSFLQSHLSKIVINGGKDALLSKIRKHYDPKYTKPNSDPSHLINEIPMVVEKSLIPELLSEIDGCISIYDAYEKQGNSYEFWSKIVFHPNSDLHEGLLKYLKADREKLSQFMYLFPELLEFFSNDSSNIRCLWKEDLFSKLVSYSSQYWELPISLLRRGIIPEEEKDDFIKRLVYKVDRFNLPSIDQTKELRKHGFLTHMKRYVLENIFKNGRAPYIRVNNKASVIMYFLKNEELDFSIVRLLNDFFERGFIFGTFFDALKTHIEEDGEFLTKFYEIAQEEGIEIHSFFKIEK